MAKMSGLEYLSHFCWTGVINGGLVGSRIAVCTVHGPLYISKPEEGKDKKACFDDALEVARAHAEDHQGEWHGNR